MRAGAGNCARERHFQSIENPSNAECDADKCVETSPGKALKPSRDISLDQSRFRLLRLRPEPSVSQKSKKFDQLCVLAARELGYGELGSKH